MSCLSWPRCSRSFCTITSCSLFRSSVEKNGSSVEIKPFAALIVHIVQNEIYLADSLLRFLWRFGPISGQQNPLGKQLRSTALSLKNNTSLKVSVSPLGFFPNTVCISLGHNFNGKMRFRQDFSTTPFFDRTLLSSCVVRFFAKLVTKASTVIYTSISINNHCLTYT